MSAGTTGGGSAVGSAAGARAGSSAQGAARPNPKDFTAKTDLRDIRFEGGGGTDFTPMLEEAARHRPDTVIVLTDLDGPAAFRPRCPVIWAVPEAHAEAAEPFGRKLVLR